MNKIIFKIVLICFSLLTLHSCKSIPHISEGTSHDELCLSSPEMKDGLFYATGSASVLEQAKSNARQDLVLQISSEVSSKTETVSTDNNGLVRRRSSNEMQAKSASIPIDQHKITETCKSDETYFVAITLSQSSLVKATKLRLNKVSKESNKTLKSAKRGSRYEKYISRKAMLNNLAAINTYTQILAQYADITMSHKTASIIARLDKFIDSSGKLVIGIKSDSKLTPLQSVVEQALNKAKLEYKPGSRNTVAVINLKAKHNNQRAGNRYIVKLNAVLDVNRGDTGKLLSRYELGKVVATSTVSYDFALQIALSDLKKRLNRHLNGDANKIRNILEFAENEK